MATATFRGPQPARPESTQFKHFMRIRKSDEVHKVYSRDETAMCLRAEFQSASEEKIENMLGVMDWGGNIETTDAMWRACRPDAET